MKALIIRMIIAFIVFFRVPPRMYPSAILITGTVSL